MTDTKERLVRAALLLFWRDGYEATSLTQVCAEAGANPGSLYYFFPSKKDLLEAALDHLLASIGKDLLEPAWTDVADPLERVFALLGAYRGSLQATDFEYGCPIGNLALELRHPPETVRRRLVANFEAWTAAVRDCLERARARFPPDTDLDRLATFILTTMEGAVMQARTRRSLVPFDQSVAALREHFEMLTGGSVEAPRMDPRA